MRNLPSTIKSNRRKKEVGTIIELEIEKKEIGGNAKTDFQFEILLRNKYPFQPPLIMAKTTLGTPTLADGRDLLPHLLP